MIVYDRNYIKGYEILTQKQKDKAYKKFIVKYKSTIEKDCMDIYLFDEEGNVIEKKPIRF